MGVEVLTVAVVALALLPLLAAARDSGSRAVLALAGIAWLGAAVGAGFATHVYREDRPVPIATAIKNRPVEIAMDGYVSSSTCGSCHPHEYATWYDSYHRTMTQVASPKTIAGPWDGIEREREGRSYRFERRGEELWTVVTEPGSATPLERQIVLLTGSHHFQFLWFATGKMRKLGLFEFAYQIAEERWIPVDGMVLAPPGVQQATLEGGGRWNKNCNRCHAVNGKPRVRNANWMDTVVAEFGIACEACHGPGEEHVAKNRDPQRRYQLHLTDDADPTIVQPARLDHARSSQVCGQCHAVQTFRSDRDLNRWVWKGSSYRPGDALDDWRRLVHKDGAFHDAREQRFWSDGAVRVNGREYNSLLGNPCFQRGEMSCLSCHSMHPPPSDERPRKEWANDQLKQGMNGSPACLQCHERFEDEVTLVAHTHHAPDSHGSNCLNCHMPNTAYGLQKATRNHGIAFPDVTTTLATGRPNACNLCHLDRSLGWTAEQLEAWYGKPQPELSDRDRNVAGAAVWTLSGDAGVRALMAWHLGWAPAQQASGTAWMAPYLAQLLIDPYDAVRSMAHHALRSLPDFESFAYDSTAALPAQHEGSRRAFRQWNQRRTGAPPADPQAVLMNKRGGLRLALFNELLKQRDDRNVYLAE